jgi:hypothetical protein
MTTEFFPVDGQTGQPYMVEPNYEIGAEYSRYLTAKLLEEIATVNPELVSTMPFICVRVDNTSEYSNLGRYVEGMVFTEDLDDKPNEMKEEYQDFEGQSKFFIVLDVHQRKPAGALRIIENGQNGFLVFNEIKDEPHNFDAEGYFESRNIDPNTTWDVWTIAVMRDYRRNAYSSEQLQRLSLAERVEYESRTPEEIAQQKVASYVVSGLLYRALYAGAQANGIKNFVSLIHVDALRTLRDLGIPFKDIEGVAAKTYYNDQTFQPCEAIVDNFHSDMLGFADNKIAEVLSLIESITDEEQKAVAKKALHKAKEKRNMIEELLNGTFLDQMFATPHEI